VSVSKRLVAFDADVDQRAKQLAQAERARDAFIAQHCADHPLSDELVAQMADHVRTGGGLCCEGGRAWLNERVDEVWARVLNGWAYDALGCSKRPPEQRQEYAQKVIERRFERKGETA